MSADDQRRAVRASPPASRRTSARNPAPPDAAACRARRRCAGRGLGRAQERGLRAAHRRYRRRRRPRGRAADRRSSGGWPAMPSEVVLTTSPARANRPRRPRQAAASSAGPSRPPKDRAASSRAFATVRLTTHDAVERALLQARRHGPRRAAGADHERRVHMAAPSRPRGSASRCATKPGTSVLSPQSTPFSTQSVLTARTRSARAVRRSHAPRRPPPCGGSSRCRRQNPAAPKDRRKRRKSARRHVDPLVGARRARAASANSRG